MSELDTSAEAVERLARAMDGTGKWHPGVLTLAAFTLRALVVERDMWRAENIKKQAACEQMGHRIAALESERDSLAATCRNVIKAANDWEQKYLAAAINGDAK